MYDTISTVGVTSGSASGFYWHITDEELNVSTEKYNGTL